MAGQTPHAFPLRSMARRPTAHRAAECLVGSSPAAVFRILPRGAHPCRASVRKSSRHAGWLSLAFLLLRVRTVDAQAAVEASTFQAEDNHQSPHRCNLAFYTWFRKAYGAQTRSVEVLDVGGGQGKLGVHAQTFMAKKRERVLHWDCIDVTPSRNCTPSQCCTVFDGVTLPRANHSKDVVLFNYVLHHAADATISLLQHARRVARRHVVVVEDLKAPSRKGALAQFAHEWHGSHRGKTEWIALFELIGLRVVYTADPGSRCAGPGPLDFPRGLFVAEVLHDAELA